MTLSQIAKEAHVSVSTASKAFSGSNEVNEETRELVFEIAKKHGCFKKFYNIKYPKLVIAIIAPEFSSMYYSRYLSLLQKNLPNCELCVSTGKFSAECERDLIDYYYKHASVDGIILIDPVSCIDFSIEIPIVVLHNTQTTKHKAVSAAVSASFREAMNEALRYLKSRDITDIGFIGEDNTKSKECLFRETMNEIGIPINESLVKRTAERFENGGYQAVDAFIHENTIPRAIICAYDYMAIGAMKCLTDHGYKIPQDVAILGMDDLPLAPYLNPPLASISSSPEIRCRLTAEAMLKAINGEETKSPIIIQAQVHNRNSFQTGKK